MSRLRPRHVLAGYGSALLESNRNRVQTAYQLCRETPTHPAGFPNPLSQFCGQPAQSRMSRPVYVLQPRWRGCFSVWHCQVGCRILNEIILLGLRRLRSRRVQPEQCFEWACANTMSVKCIQCTAEYIARYTQYKAVNKDTLWHITAFRTSFVDDSAWQSVKDSESQTRRGH